MLDLNSFDSLRKFAQVKMVESAVGKDLVANLTLEALEIDFAKLVANIPTLAKLPGLSICMFLTIEAVQLLLTAPNYYWFWKSLRNAGLREGFEKISFAEIEQEFQDQRKNLSRSIALRVEIESMTAADVALRVAHGVLLVDFENGKPIVVYNPILTCSR